MPAVNDTPRWVTVHGFYLCSHHLVCNQLSLPIPLWYLYCIILYYASTAINRHWRCVFHLSVCVSVHCPSGCCLSIVHCSLTFVLWPVVSSVTGISMKLGTDIHHVNGHGWEGFQYQRSFKVKLTLRPNALLCRSDTFQWCGVKAYEFKCCSLSICCNTAFTIAFLFQSCGPWY